MKTNLTRILCLTAFLFFLSGCKKDEDPAHVSQASADFAYDTSINSTVQFSNLSRNYTSLTWDFGDGKTSSEIYPKHTYATTGTVQVKLTVKGGSNESTVTKPVIVK